jgi:uncharacterized protein YndB with AHSA1/START domain
MAEMLHRIWMAGSLEEVYQAITTSRGLASWWTDDALAVPEIESVAEFGFANRTVVFRMRVDALEEPRTVLWRCIGGPDEWVGTFVEWELSTTEDGRTQVDFVHGDWKEANGMYALCNTTWGHLMHHLKEYVEGMSAGPHYASAQV